jgi:hypothetical protein
MPSVPYPTTDELDACLARILIAASTVPPGAIGVDGAGTSEM